MKKIVLAAFAAAVAFPAAAAPGDTDTATGTATAEIVAPISITSNADLNFGTIAVEPAGGADGTISVDFANGATEGGAGGAALVPQGITPSSASFTVTGQTNLTYTVTVDPSVTLNGPGGDSMTATLSSESSGDTIGGGNDTFAVGGTLSVAAGQTAGTYSGTFEVTAAYN